MDIEPAGGAKIQRALSEALLEPGEELPFQVVPATGRTRFVVICEHAGNAIPRRLGDLGIAAVDRERHIAWDPGAREVALGLAARLGAPSIFQTYSRLVCDCNRSTEEEDFILSVSDGTFVVGNQGISDEQRQARIDEIYLPFHEAARVLLESHDDRGEGLSHVVTVHSFTPVLSGSARPWHVGVLYSQPNWLASGLIEWLNTNTDYQIGDNEPYSLLELRSETIVRHAEGRGRTAVEIEIRNDLITTAAEQHHWADILARGLEECLGRGEKNE